MRRAEGPLHVWLQGQAIGRAEGPLHVSTGVPCRGSFARLATGVCGLFQLPGQAPQNPSIMTFSTGFQPSLGHLLRIYPGIQNFWIMEPGSHIQKSRISGFLDIPKSLGPPSLIPHISRHPEFLDYGTRFTYPEIQNFWISGYPQILGPS